MPDDPRNGVLLRQDYGAVVLLTLSRPGARNSLSEGLLNALREKIAALGADRGVKVIVITGAPPAFCAGHDLRELSARRIDADGGKAYFAQIMALCSCVMQAVTLCPKPVIAAVNGIATAAGCQLVAACDLAVAAPEARFATPGVNIGLFCSTPMTPLSRVVAPKHAMEMLLTGDLVSAEKAAAIGLVNRIAAPGRVVAETLALAEQIASKSGEAIAFGKRAFYAQLDLPLSEAYALATRVMVENMMAADACEGINAFVEKRPPRWTD